LPVTTGKSLLPPGWLSL